MREEQKEVMVVGAGPVGLWTALLLAEAGIGVTIIDREERTTARSYACALHPRTLKSLHRLGLAQELLGHGRQIGRVAFYDGEQRRGEIKLSDAGGQFPFLLILPQDKLESTLEQALRNKGVSVQWNHRFDVVQEEIDSVEVIVEELGGTSVGYIVPHWETIVKRRWPVWTRFLIGADGHNSLVRQRLGIDYERVSGPEFFAAYEFESDDHGEDEVRVVLDETTTNVLWPLPQNRFRWTFQLLHSEIAAEFPDKERRAVRVAQQNVDERIRHYVQKVAKHRAPWFSAKVNEIAWCTEVSFEHRLAKAFGRNRCWLVGDAAHQTGPVGVQSMNSGFAEVEVLAAALKQVLPGNAPMSVLDDYSQSSKHLWRRLLGLTGGLKPRQETDPWMKQRHARLLPCLPGLNGDLEGLAKQLKLDLA